MRFLSAASSCHGEAAEAQRSDAGRLVHAVAELRDAPNDGKRPLLKALEQLDCAAPDLCEFRKTCVSAYSLDVDALDGLDAVKRATADARVPVSKSAVELLARSEGALGRSVELAKRCADLEGEARRRYSL